MSGAVIFNGDYVKALKSKLKLGEAAYIETGSADPTTLSLSSPLGSLYLRSNGTLYVKYGAGASAWAPTLTTGTGGTLTSTALQDSTVYFADETDPTKKLYFQLSGISGNTSRTLTIPNADGSVTLGTGTSNYVAYWSNTNTLTSEAQLSPTRGGTGASNTGLFSYGSNNITLTTTASTSLTLPTSGTLATLAGAENLTNKTINSSSIGATTASSGAFTFLTLKGTGVAGTAYFDFLNESVTPSSPLSGYTRIYFKSDGSLYYLSSAAVEKKIGDIAHPTTGSTFETGAFNASMTGTNNTAIGVASLDSVTLGVQNTAFGTNALTALTTGSNNTAVGYNSLITLTDGADNTAIGWRSMRLVTSGYSNTAVGNQSSELMTTGTDNTAVGYFSLRNVTDGFGNVAIGSGAGLLLGGYSNNNVCINTGGALTPGSVLSGTVTIGKTAAGGGSYATANNQFVLGDSGHLYRFPGIAETSLILGPTGTLTGNGGELRFRELAANGTNSVAFKAADSIAANVTWTLPSADGTNGQALITNGSGTLRWAEATNTIVEVTQNSHGFTTADIGRPLYLNGSTYTYAIANATNTAEVAGLIYKIVDTNTFLICLSGEVASVGANLIEGAGSAVSGYAFTNPWTVGQASTYSGSTFVTSVGGNASSINLRCQAIAGAITGTAVVQIYELTNQTGTGVPTGSPIAVTQSLNVSTLVQSVVSIVSLNFTTTASLVAGRYYGIIVYNVVSSAGQFRLFWDNQTAGIPANSRGLSSSNGTSWTPFLSGSTLTAEVFVSAPPALTAGETYFLSPTTAGKITTSDPTVVGQVSKPLGVARSTTAFEFFNMRGSVVGGANARTQISLSNNAITTIQVASAYDAGELTGWVTIDATTDYRFYVQAQFAKNGAGTDYNISYQTMGDVPPLGFSVTITAAGLIQITLPNIAGFVNASVNFALNAPAVGATFPLTIGEII